MTIFLFYFRTQSIWDGDPMWRPGYRNFPGKCLTVGVNISNSCSTSPSRKDWSLFGSTHASWWWRSPRCATLWLSVTLCPHFWTSCQSMEDLVLQVNLFFSLCLIEFRVNRQQANFYSDVTLREAIRKHVSKNTYSDLWRIWILWKYLRFFCCWYNSGTFTSCTSITYLCS